MTIHMYQPKPVGHQDGGEGNSLTGGDIPP